MALSSDELKHINKLVRHFKKESGLFKVTLDAFHKYFVDSNKLKPYIHTIKSRIKDPVHLQNKIIRKWNEAKANGEDFEITTDNLFHKINDLIGFRIIHLHTKQIELIDKHLRAVLKGKKCQILEGPEAKTWDDESKNYFESLKFKTVANKNMYTSVHYVIQPNPILTCEIQVRTLMEEVWGEVDHTINYPEQTQSNSCREQIKVLARVTSGCSRLVDSIFLTHEEYFTKGVKKKGSK